MATTSSISPGFQRIVKRLRRHDWQIDIHDQEQFVELPLQADLRRFSRYWRQAQPQLAEYYAKYFIDKEL